MKTFDLEGFTSAIELLRDQAETTSEKDEYSLGKLEAYENVLEVIKESVTEEAKTLDYERMWKELEKTLISKKHDIELSAKHFFDINCTPTAKGYMAIVHGYQVALEAMGDVKTSERERVSLPIEAATPIEDLNFSVRTYNCLRRAGKNTVGDLLEMTYTKLFSIRNLGRHSADEVKANLESVGLKLKEEGE